MVASRFIRFLVWSIAVMLLCGIPSPAGARVVEVIGSGAQPLSLAVNTGRLIRLDAAPDTVFVADPDIADIQVKSPRLIYLFARKAGKTSLFAVDSKERVLLSLSVIVGYDLERLRSEIRSVLPDAAITVDLVSDTLVLEGIVATAHAAEEARRIAARFAHDESKLMNRLKVAAPNQINLRVRVAEISRDITKQLGFNWSVSRAGSIAVALATANPAAAAIPNALSLAADIGRLDLNVVIDALEENNLVSILAEPNLTAMSGETASFLAGGEFPILVPEEEGRITVEFKQFGVSLDFTPTLLDDSRINLHIRPEVSQLSSTGAVELNGFTIPALTTRRAETTVELASGQSLAIAGLLQRNSNHDIDKVPGLGDIPVLGALFRSDAFQREETELVIIITPYVVRPVSRPLLAAPTDGFELPHDRDRILFGSTYRNSPNARDKLSRNDGSRLAGSVGFQLE